MATKKENLRPEAATLSYSDACLGDEGTRELCSQLLDHRMLTSLDLRGCQIHAAGTAAITQLLLHTSAPPINTISLEWNNLGTSDAGPKSLATAIAKSRTLTSLDLSANEDLHPRFQARSQSARQVQSANTAKCGRYDLVTAV